MCLKFLRRLTHPTHQTSFPGPMKTPSKMPQKHRSYACQQCSDKAALRASEIVYRSIQKLKNPPILPEVADILDKLEIHHSNPYRRVVVAAVSEERKGHNSKLNPFVRAIRARHDVWFSVTLPLEDWAVLEQTFAWLAELELRSPSSGLYPQTHHRLAVNTCLQEGEQHFMDPEIWSWWLHRYGHGIAKGWLFDNPDATESKLVPERADQLQWLDRVGQIVISLGGDWNCERLLDNDDEETTEGDD